MKREKPRRKITFVFSALLAAVLAVALLWRFFESYQKRVWSYPGRLNLLDSRQLILLSFPFSWGELLEIELPKEAYVEVPGGYGEYKLKNVKALGEVESRGEELLERTVSATLGVPVSGEAGSLTFWDKAKIWLKKREIEGRKRRIKLEKLPVFSQEERPDGSKIKKVDPAKIDFHLREIFWEKKLREEKLAIGVFNASKEAGIAKKWARLIENIGGRVVEVANWKEEASCQIRVREKFKRSVTLRRLRRIFPCPLSFAQIEPRFDLILVVTESI